MRINESFFQDITYICMYVFFRTLCFTIVEFPFPSKCVYFRKSIFSVITRFGAWETALNSVLYANMHRHTWLYASSGSRPTMSIIPYHPLITNVFPIDSFRSFRCYVCRTKRTDNSHVDVRIYTRRYPFELCVFRIPISVPVAIYLNYFFARDKIKRVGTSTEIKIKKRFINYKTC